MERMEGDLNTADWLLRGMRSYTGALVNYFVAPPPQPEPAVTESKQRPVQRKTCSSSMNRGDIVIGTHDLCTAPSEAYLFFLLNRRRRGVGADGVRQACK